MGNAIYIVKSYTANALNQYTAIANPDAVALRGVATNTATVTVNGNAASRDSVVSTWTSWHHALPTDNANGGVFTFAEIMAAINPPGTNTPDLVSTASGNVYAPPQEEVVTYDDDGNLVSDGRWQYTWNGENRLVKAEELISPTNRQPYVVEYTYDHRGRMIWKTVASSNAPSSKAIRYLWDDYNIVAETVVQDTATNTTYNIWGLDVDGTLQGAGGVGGLLAVVKDSATYIPAYDANGNIMEYVASDGRIVAHREYDPFGGTVVEIGDTDALSHWFSTKPWCSVTGLSEYQYRKYSPALGRWLSRDPIGDFGSKGQYVVCLNNCIYFIDLLGMSPSINNNAGFTIILIGNYGLSKDCINWINNHKSSYNGIDATEGIANVFMLLPNNMNTKYGMRMIDVDGYWTKNAPGTEGEARKIQRSYEITSANIETCGSRATDGAFQGEFLKDGSPEWYLRERLEKSWLDAILQGKKECFCNDGDVESIRAAIISTQRALAHYPNIK